MEYKDLISMAFALAMTLLFLRHSIQREAKPSLLILDKLEALNISRWKLLGLLISPLLILAGPGFSQTSPVAPNAPGGPQAAARGRGFVRRPLVYETIPPQLPSNLNEMAVLIFSKTQAYRYDDAMEA